jgi:nucleoside triphosphate diphosphatase
MNDYSLEMSQLARLLDIVHDLRERCPWDREQKLADVTKYLIEEAYEAADAIARGDPLAIADELGDLLVQVLFAAVIAEQERRFTFVSLPQKAADKLVRRHPHIYAGGKAETAAEVVAKWNQIKSEERKAEGFHSALDGITRGLPALMRAEKLGRRARQAGMDWADIHEVLAKVREEMDELEGALAADDTDAAARELGDMMLALANAPRFIGHDAEETLRRACEKFIRRFEKVEQIASARGLDLTKMTTAEVESLWQEAKRLDDAAISK